MEPHSHHFARANGRNGSPPPRPTPPPSTEVVPLIDDHGLIHGGLAGNRAAPVPSWAGLEPGTVAGVVPPRSPATVMRGLWEDSSGDEADSGDGPFAFVETEEDLLQLGIQKSLRRERRQAIRRRRYQRHLDEFNERQLQRGLRADEDTQAKKREWDAIAASQFEQPTCSCSCSSSDSSED